MDKKVILVSGASSGLGLAVTNHLVLAGHVVYAAARSYKVESVEMKEKRGNGILKKVFLDVTDNAGIDNLVQKIIQQEGKLDALVNCAACLVLGAVEDTGIQEYRQVMETNFIGTLNMCKSVLPVMREQKNGVIINFSSINGAMGIPFQSAYTASKFAIEGLSECLSMEVKDYGIRVIMIEPGDHRSGSGNYRLHAAKADSPDSPYSKAFKAAVRRIAQDEANGSDPEGVAKLVAGIINNKKPRLRYVIGKLDQKFAVFFLKRIISGRMFEKIIADYYKK